MAETQLNPLASTLPSTPPMLLTAEDLWKMPDDSYRYELVKGVLRKMPPAGFEHGIRSVKIGSLLHVHVEKHGLGYVCAAETGFTIARNPDTVRAPDAAFVRREFIEKQGIVKGYWEGAPALAVEVISPSDTYTEVAEKVEDWLTAGCAMVWVINPRRETVEVHRPGEECTVLSVGDTLEGGNVVEGFRCEVEELFV